MSDKETIFILSTIVTLPLRVTRLIYPPFIHPVESHYFNQSTTGIHNDVRSAPHAAATRIITTTTTTSTAAPTIHTYPTIPPLTTPPHKHPLSNTQHLRRHLQQQHPIQHPLQPLHTSNTHETPLHIGIRTTIPDATTATTTITPPIRKKTKKYPIFPQLCPPLCQQHLQPHDQALKIKCVPLGTPECVFKSREAGSG